MIRTTVDRVRRWTTFGLALLSAYAVPMSAAVVAWIVAPSLGVWLCDVTRVAIATCGEMDPVTRVALRGAFCAGSFLLAQRWLN